MCRSRDPIPPDRSPVDRQDAIRESDRRYLEEKLKQEAPALAVSRVVYSVDQQIVAAVAGWTWYPETLDFSRIIEVADNRTYSLEGQFKKAPNGEWGARLTRMRRLATLEECARLGFNANPNRDIVFKVIPSTAEARHALVTWLRNSSYQTDKPLVAFLEKIGATRYLKQQELAERLATERARESRRGALSAAARNGTSLGDQRVPPRRLRCDVVQPG